MDIASPIAMRVIAAILDFIAASCDKSDVGLASGLYWTCWKSSIKRRATLREAVLSHACWRIDTQLSHPLLDPGWNVFRSADFSLGAIPKNTRNSGCAAP